MEVIPFLDFDCIASPGVWYLMSTEGEGPSARVGHASLVCHCPQKEEAGLAGDSSATTTRVIVVSGATPSGPFNDVYYLELSTSGFNWVKTETESLTPRYEHGIIEDKEGNIFVFGGAQQEHNVDSIQVLKRGESKWNDVNPKGCPPSPRTCLNVATIDEMMYIFGGGLQGAKPVTDTHLHIFDTANCSWSQPECTGRCPTPRHGHLMVAANKKIYVHGGMAERDLHNDLFIFDTETKIWDEIKQSGDIPSSRAAHAGTTVDNFIYIFGGMNYMGALDDLYKFDIDFLVWSKIEIQGCTPPPRLDHTLSCVEVSTKQETGDEASELKKQRLLIVFGGMDTTGQIFDDLLAIAVS